MYLCAFCSCWCFGEAQQGNDSGSSHTSSLTLLMLLEDVPDYISAWYFLSFYDAIEFVIGCLTSWLFFTLQAWILITAQALMAEAPRSADSKASEVHRPVLNGAIALAKWTFELGTGSIAHA